MRQLYFLLALLVLTACQRTAYAPFTTADQEVPCTCKTTKMALVEAEDYLAKNFNQAALIATLEAAGLDIPVDLSTATYSDYTLFTTKNGAGEEQLLTWVKILKDCSTFEFQPIKVEGNEGYVLENTPALQQALKEKNCRAVRQPVSSD